jgi:two-component system LytT family sensor kinase
VPTLSVQPLVENAVRHGVERRAGSGQVEIAARVKSGNVELRVSDDGAGIEADRIPGVLAGTGGGIGLSNVDARLRATFGERYALHIESTPGQGTTVVMTVPNLSGATVEPPLSVAASPVGK